MLLALTGLLVGSVDCAQERAAIDRTQDNALSKSFFIGSDYLSTADDPEYYVNNYVVDGSVFPALPADHDFAAILFDPFEGRMHLFDCRACDERAHERVSFQRISDPDLLIAFHQSVGEIIGNVLVHDDPAGRGAALPGSSHRAEQDGTGRQLQIGILGHDDCIVPAELQNGPAKPAGDSLRDAPADDGRAGK